MEQVLAKECEIDTGVINEVEIHHVDTWATEIDRLRKEGKFEESTLAFEHRRALLKENETIEPVLEIYNAMTLFESANDKIKRQEALQQLNKVRSEILKGNSFSNEEVLKATDRTSQLLFQRRTVMNKDYIVNTLPDEIEFRTRLAQIAFLAEPGNLLSHSHVKSLKDYAVDGFVDHY